MLWRLLRRRRYLRFTRYVAGAIKRRLYLTTAMFAGLFCLHVLAMIVFEGMTLGNAAWLTMTTATTVGYGDASAATTAGRLATVVCIYIFGTFLLAQIATYVFDYRALHRDRRRRGEIKWSNMKDHLLVINVPSQDAENYLPRLVDHVRRAPRLGDIPIQLLTPSFEDGLSTELVDAGVTLYNAMAENSENLAAANVCHARCIIIIADEIYDARSDAHTYDILGRIRQLGSQATIVAEVVDDANRQRILEAGATTVIRPIRAYPEFVVRALTAPGVEQVLETMFTHEAGRLARFEAQFEGLLWRDVVVNFARGNAGIPMGYFDQRGVHTNPAPDEICSGNGIITLINDSLNVTRPLVESCLRAS